MNIQKFCKDMSELLSDEWKGRIIGPVDIYIDNKYVSEENDVYFLQDGESVVHCECVTIYRKNPLKMWFMLADDMFDQYATHMAEEIFKSAFEFYITENLDNAI